MQGTLSESSWVTAVMLDTSKGHPRFLKVAMEILWMFQTPLPPPKEAIHRHRINDIFLVEILVTVFSD